MLCSCFLLQGSYTVLLFHISKCYWSWWQKHSQPILHHCQDHGPSRGWCNKCRCYLKSNLCKKRANMGLTGRQLLENIYKNLTFLHPPNQFVFSYFEKFIFSFVQLQALLQWAFLSSHTVLSYWNFSFGKCLKAHFNHWKPFSFKNIEKYSLKQPLNVSVSAIQWFLSTTVERVVTPTTVN